ncbi:hypothetical protein VSR82_37260 [Burkholderia sp. JPY481]
MDASTTVYVHAGRYLAHDLASAMPLVCVGRYIAIAGELGWERIARALQHVESGGPYPICDALTIFVRESGVLTTRFDVVMTTRGAETTIVISGLPRWTLVPVCVEEGDDVLTVARKLFAVGLPDAQ